MKKKIFTVSILLSSLLTLSACGSDEKTTVLRLLNLEDYIYVQDFENGYDEIDLVDQFVEYIANDEELSEKYGKVSVVYDTTDTNESLYSEMQTGKSAYDLICTSDYMLQKLVTYDLIEELDWDETNNCLDIPNYVQYASKEIKSTLDNIQAKRFGDTESSSLGKFAVGYMWGTLGILFNPNFSLLKDREINEEKVFYDMMSWDVFWNSDYKNTISIKDSMRDTYAMGVMYTYREELIQLKNDYESGTYTTSEYNAILSDIFNRCEENNVKEVEKSLNALKDNIFGLEVDSGKQDIVTGKIGVNLAWSGDAVYSIDQAEDPTQVTTVKDLYYSIPETGSNIWFDAWAMPKIDRSQEQRDLAHEFLNFICDPVYASKNMDYNGYTPFIAGDSILELTRDWYDVRTYEIYQEVEVGADEYEYYSIFAVNNNDKYELSYDDCLSSKKDVMKSDWLLKYWVPSDDEDETVDDNELFPVELEDGSNKAYKDLMNADIESNDPLNSGIEKVDLTYFFNETLDEYDDVENMCFYSDCYLPIYYEDDKGDIKHNISVGRQFFTQFPDQQTMERCVVMRDFGKNNEHIMRMWENFKSNPLPVEMIILFVIEIVLILGATSFFILNKNIKKRLRKRRKESLK